MKNKLLDLVFQTDIKTPQVFGQWKIETDLLRFSGFTVNQYFYKG